VVEIIGQEFLALTHSYAVDVGTVRQNAVRIQGGKGAATIIGTSRASVLSRRAMR